ncbi:hypothetical protein HD806DRAFT_517264 [Xylariaceae sp. AK1471]|nr:hypothetical protein HD806DRAFT_517264 [Xylariaceae sp. AK1471]
MRSEKRINSSFAMQTTSNPLLEASSQHGKRTRASKPLQKLWHIVKESWRQACADLRTRWPFALTSIRFWGLLISLGMLLSHSFRPSKSVCRSDGTFSLFDVYSYWNPSGFFQINFGFGDFTFTEAKIIDIVWDVVIGRGGQAVMALVAWRAFGDYATVSMHTIPLTYTSYIKLILESGPSFVSICRLIRDFKKHRCLKSKLVAAWVVFSMLFILAWPTLIAAMSGYAPKIGAYIQINNTVLIPYDQFQLLAFIIHDGDRVNLTQNLAVPLDLGPQSSEEYLLHNESGHYTAQVDPFCNRNMGYSRSEEYACNLQQIGIDYIKLYGSRQNKISRWNATDVPIPSLDIEVSVLYTSLLPSSNPIVSNNPSWAYDGDIYTLQNIRDGGRCNPLGESFQWGFSYVQLVVVLVLLTVWSACTCLLFQRVQPFLPLLGQPERPRGTRALLLLADSVNTELQVNGIDPHTLTDKQLKQRIHQTLRGGSVSSGFTLREKKARTSQRRVPWMKFSIVWTCCVIAFASVDLVSFLINGSFSYLSVFSNIAFLLLTACYTGTTAKSRCLLAAMVCTFVPLIIIRGVFYLLFFYVY